MHRIIVNALGRSHIRARLQTSVVLVLALWSMAATAATCLQRILNGWQKRHTRNSRAITAEKTRTTFPLSEVPSNLFGITIVTVDGKVINVRLNSSILDSILLKVFTMCLVMQESGDKTIYDKINVGPPATRSTRSSRSRKATVARITRSSMPAPLPQ